MPLPGLGQGAPQPAGALGAQPWGTGGQGASPRRSADEATLATRRKHGGQQSAQVGGDRVFVPLGSSGRCAGVCQPGLPGKSCRRSLAGLLLPWLIGRLRRPAFRVTWSMAFSRNVPCQKVPPPSREVEGRAHPSENRFPHTQRSLDGTAGNCSFPKAPEPSVREVTEWSSQAGWVTGTFLGSYYFFTLPSSCRICFLNPNPQLSPGFFVTCIGHLSSESLLSGVSSLIWCPLERTPPVPGSRGWCTLGAQP